MIIVLFLFLSGLFDRNDSEPSFAVDKSEGSEQSANVDTDIFLCGVMDPFLELPVETFLMDISEELVRDCFFSS